MPRVAAVVDDPAAVWAALASKLAGQPRVRISRDGGASYPQRYERNLTDQLPTLPAAVRIYGKDGTCQSIFLDFDSSVDGVDRVDADVYRVTSWLHSHGARWIADYSPNGGRHIYIPLTSPVPFSDARELVEALGTIYRSLDRTPHQNLLHGCMRTPGSVHKRGGHQQLDMSLSMAYDVAMRRNDQSVWSRLVADLRDEVAAVRALRLEQHFTTSTDDPQAAAEPVRGMSRAMLSVATSGLYDANRYLSPSEARQAVLLSSAAAGLTLLDVERRIKQGVWPGLAQFYARYKAPHRFKTLEREWRKAIAYLNQSRAKKNNDRRSPTSEPNTQAGVVQGSPARGLAGEHEFIRTWRNALSIAELRYKSSREGMARRMVLRAIGAAAHMRGSRHVEFGVRSTAVATGMDHTTVAAHLRALRSEHDPLITLVENGRGTKGDLYVLTIPAGLQDSAESISWRKGPQHALRPAFRELGMPAAFVYEELEHSPTPLSTTDLVRATGISRTAVSEALEILAGWNLVSRSGDRGSWSLEAGSSLSTLAEHLGVLESVQSQVSKYRAERRAWHQWLAQRPLQLLPSPGEDYPWEMFEGPPPDDLSLADIAFSRYAG